ncbi:RILP-like protein 2 isoform X2 [Tachyglossus aculeatus]|uniref:RILP-like protein 2 isoform X2 n=1 Tax=Tachyglossus aculeatus TaxID=9261 RepID=UPI0018F70113|nr:RILP-like protein 2 isoform X2 [Tachyglossus aculeatus]
MCLCVRGGVCAAEKKETAAKASFKPRRSLLRRPGLLIRLPGRASNWGVMEQHPCPVGAEEEEEEEEGEEDSGPESAFGKNPFQLTAEDVYDISYVVGRELMAIGGEPREVPSRVARLQFRIVRVLEMLETLVNQCNLTTEELKMERDNLRQEVEGLRREGPPASSAEVNLGPDKMVIDLSDPNRPRFTLQELRDVLQERNKLKSQLLVAQEELQCYKSGLISPAEGPVVRRESEPQGGSSGTSASGGKAEKTIIKRL